MKLCRCGNNMKMEARVSCVRWRNMMTWQCMVSPFSEWRIMTRVIHVVGQIWKVRIATWHDLVELG